MATRTLVAIYNEYTSSWVNLPTPSDYTGSATTIVNSARNASGQVIADVVRSNIAKVELHWNYLTKAQFAMIAQLFEEEYHGSFINAVSFFDVVKGDFDGSISTAPNASTNRCRMFYPNDRKVDFAKMKLDANNMPVGYVNVSLNLIDTCKIYGE